MNNLLLSKFRFHQQLLCLSLLLLEADDDKTKRIVIPYQVILSATKGLELHSKFGGGKNINIAKMLTGKRPVSLEHINQMIDFLETYEQNRDYPRWDGIDIPSIDHIHWCLMGGGLGYKWATDVKRKVKEERNIKKYIFELGQPTPQPKTQTLLQRIAYS
jgi:hypothetical protein